MKVKKHFCSFSEAIREGLAISPNQAFFKLTVNSENASCVVGAAIEAWAGRQLSASESMEWRRIFDAVHKFDYMETLSEAPCGCAGPLENGTVYPKAGGSPRRTDRALVNICVHLNNHHCWTREDIADWLETEEEKLGYVLLTEEPEAYNTKDSVRSPELAGVLA